MPCPWTLGAGFLIAACALTMGAVGCRASHASSSPAGSFQLEPGDLLFQDLDCGPTCEAIESVTTGIQGADLSHVAMVTRVDVNGVQVIEAYANGVEEVPLDRLLERSRDGRGQPKVLVARVRDAHRSLLPAAIASARRRLGRPYDSDFAMGNGAYYCSELIYEAFAEANGGTPVFELEPMTFRDPETGETARTWQAYFDERRRPIPEGEPGLNPGGMSRSSSLRIVHAFGSPEGWRARH